MIKQPFKTFRQRGKRYSSGFVLKHRRQYIILVQFLSLRFSNYDLQTTLLKIACFESKCKLPRPESVQ